MTEEQKQEVSINKGCKKISATGNVIEEKWCTVKGFDMKVVADEFNKQWGELK